MKAWWTSSDPEVAPSSRLADVGLLLDGLQVADGQRAVQQRMRRFAAEHPDALHRSCIDGHFTGSALVVDHATERTLLLFHRKLQRWLQPGGHADGDANLAGVALREASEETGIIGLSVDPAPLDLDIHVVPEPGGTSHLHLDVRFLVVAPAGAIEQRNHESEALRWFRADEVHDLGLDRGTLRLITAGLTRARARG